MKRHSALVGLSYDHHHGLVQARRLRRAVGTDPPDRRDAAAAFLEFFARDTRPHFRDEEERFFPLLVGAEEPATEQLAQALLEHQQLYALVSTLQGELAAGDASEATMRHLARALEDHIRFEERSLFPLIEKVAPEDLLRQLEDDSARRGAVELRSPEGTRPLWGTETEDLNATLLAWPPGAGPPEHVNSERDVLLVVLAGSATVTVDGRRSFSTRGRRSPSRRGARDGSPPAREESATSPSTCAGRHSGSLRHLPASSASATPQLVAQPSRRLGGGEVERASGSARARAPSPAYARAPPP